MAEREAEGGVGELHAVGGADRLDPGDAVEDLGWRRVVVVVGAGPWAGGEDAGVVGPADHDADPARLAKRQEGVERLLFEEGVAAGEQEDVEIPALGQPLAGLPFVDACAEGRDHALVAQFEQRAVAAFEEFAEPRVEGRRAAVVEGVEVVGVEDVDAVYAEAFERGFERAEDGVVAVVVDLGAGGDLKPLADAVAPVGRDRLEEASDLGREDIGVAGLVPEEAVEAGLGQAEAVERRGVVVAHPGLPGAGQERVGLGVGDRPVEVAERRRSEAEFREAQAAGAVAVPGPGIQGHVARLPGSC